MKSSFKFDGTHLILTLTVEDKMEQAVAQLMESYSIATVNVKYEEYGGYQRTDSVKEIRFILRQPMTDDERPPL